METFNDIFIDCTSLGTKIPKEEYLVNGKHIVVDQGQNAIAGYTDLDDGLFEDVPAIIFGDHTRVIKYVDEPFFLGADGVKLLKSKKQDANYKYLYYALKNARIPDTGYNRHFKWLKEVSIEYPNLNRQQEIVEVLDKITKIIEERKLELLQLDDLIKARFVEMFGNPFDAKTPVVWPIKTINDLAESISDGSNVDKALYKEQGDVLFLRIQNVWCNEFRLDDSVYISESENEEYIDTSLKHGDLLITKIGRYYTADSSLGRVSVYLGDDDKANYSNNIMRVRFKEGINSEFANALMNLDDYNKFIRRTSVGGTDKRALSKGLIASYPVIVPSIEKQNEFVDFVHQVDKSKVVAEKNWNIHNICLVA